MQEGGADFAWWIERRPLGWSNQAVSPLALDYHSWSVCSKEECLPIPYIYTGNEVPKAFVSSSTHSLTNTHTETHKWQHYVLCLMSLQLFCLYAAHVFLWFGEMFQARSRCHPPTFLAKTGHEWIHSRHANIIFVYTYLNEVNLVNKKITVLFAESCI